ncbi:MAG: dienelactone hydrolase [Alphaproteobacteria bacterium]|nr:dienelactone hydrolase [Alphaproteobacteria bacterium]
MKPTLLTIVLYLAMACSVMAEPNAGFERFDNQAERPGTTSVDSSSQATAVELDAGVQQIVVRSQERGTDLDVIVWYPASPGGEAVLLGESVFFEGTEALRNAPISTGRFPLILLSHGAGLAGRAEALSWIATALAKEGFIVAAPTHPGNTGPDRSAAETMKLWLRPPDLSETLDAIAKSEAFQPHVNADRIGALGLSMGGSTALSIAGGRLDPELLANYCDTNELNASLCDWVRLSGVDLHAMNKQVASRDNRDERIRFVMAIDPVPVDVFAVETFSGISIPVALINLGKDGEIPSTAQAADTANAIPDASYEVIEEASHFSMFAECKPGAAEIAVQEGIEEPICTDGNGSSRHTIHAQLIDMITAAFNRALKQGS